MLDVLRRAGHRPASHDGRALPDRRLHVFSQEGVVFLGILDAVVDAVVCGFVDVPAVVPDIVQGAKRGGPVDGARLFDPTGSDHVYILQGEFLDAILSLVLPFIPGYSFEGLDLVAAAEREADEQPCRERAAAEDSRRSRLDGGKHRGEYTRRF